MSEVVGGPAGAGPAGTSGSGADQDGPEITADEAVTEAQEANAAAQDARKEAQLATQDAREAKAGAEQAEQSAENAEQGAEKAEHRAEKAEHGAEEAEQGAEQAERGAEAARDGAEAAAVEATRAAMESDALLLDEEAQRLAAQVAHDQPFGLPGPARNRRSLVRVGFTVAFGGLLAVALAAAVVALEQALIIIVVAAFIAMGLEPAVSWLVRRGLRRGVAVLVISLLALAALAAFVAAAVPPIANEATHLVKQGPAYLQELQNRNTTIGHLNAQFHIEDKLRAAAAQKLSINALGGLLSVGTAIVSFAFEVVIVIVLTIYFLAEFPDIKRFFYRLAPLPRRPRVGLLGDEIIARTGGYILGNLFTSLIAVISQYVILRILGVPFALVLSIFVGLLDLVPLVGSTIAGAFVTLVTLAAVSLSAAVINVVFTLAYRLVEDYLINPRVLKRTVDVRPVVTVVAVLLGGTLFGIVGALIAVPVAAAAQLIITEVVFPGTDAADGVQILGAPSADGV